MRVVHYVRVSTDEQGKSGYSVREQLHTLNAHSAARGDEVIEEIADEGYSGASAERPGLARVMELAESGQVDVVRAVKRDRLFRSRLYRLLTERDLEEFGVKLEALNDTGHRIGDGVQDDFAEWEREEITRRTLSGKLQKAREGKIIAGRLPVYGFRYTEDRNHYEVDEAKMAATLRRCGAKGGGSWGWIAYNDIVGRPQSRRIWVGNRRNVNKMMQQVQQMQQQMQQAQEELAQETVTASAGGGAVKATMTGGMELVSIEIDPEVVDPEDVEMLQDMVLAAVNEAMTSAQELANKKLGGITGGLGDLGLNLPGL